MFTFLFLVWFVINFKYQLRFNYIIIITIINNTEIMA